ncbi:MAG: hypothetical protein ACK4SY_10390, partial [Pyrobaculum sp.]
LFNDFDLLVFIDGVPELEAPKLYVVNPSPARERLPTAVAYVDTHDLNPAKLALLAYAAGLYKSETYLVGIPVERLEPGEELSDKTRRSIPQALRLVEEILKNKGLDPQLDNRCVEEETNSPPTARQPQ